MPKKTYLPGNGKWRVTFELPAAAVSHSAYLAGDFNKWSTETTPMIRRKDGRFSQSLDLEGGRQYRFRYWVDGERWENDWAADAYAANDYGGDDSVLILEESAPPGVGSSTPARPPVKKAPAVAAADAMPPDQPPGAVPGPPPPTPPPAPPVG